MAKAPEKPTDKAVDPLVTPPPATATGNSTGTTTLTVSNVTGNIAVGTGVVGAGVQAGTIIVAQLSGPPGKAGTYQTSVATTLTNIPISFIVGPTLSSFPAFVPIIPPPAIGVGGGNPPNYPPPTPPPIGAIPPGVLVGPVVAAAAVPPSVAGFALIQYKTGSATSPTAASWIPQFTTTFPAPTVVFSNIYTGGKPPVTPPSTASTLCIVLNGWGPNVPAGAPTTPGSDGRLPRSLSGLMAMEAEKANGNGKREKRKAV